VLAARRRLGGPVPASLYVAMAAAGGAGLVLGKLYSSFVLDASTPIPMLVFAFFLEALVAAWFGHKRFGRALTVDQRARIALFYTLLVGTLIAIPTALGSAPWSERILDRWKELSSAGVVLAIVVVALLFAAVALARFLVIALVAPLVGKKQSRA
jgi:hypothetical protein